MRIRDVVANILDRDIIVSKFKFQAHDCVYNQTNTLGEGMNSFILSAME